MQYIKNGCKKIVFGDCQTPHAQHGPVETQHNMAQESTHVIPTFVPNSAGLLIFPLQTYQYFFWEVVLLFNHQKR